MIDYQEDDSEDEMTDEVVSEEGKVISIPGQTQYSSKPQMERNHVISDLNLEVQAQKINDRVELENC